MSRYWVITMLFLLSVVLPGCITPVAAPTAQGPDGKLANELPFETIERREWGENERWEDTAPRLLIIADPDGAENAKAYLSQEAGEALEAIDFTTHLAILAFRGWYSRGQLDFEIMSIAQQDDEISIVAEPGRRTNAAEVSSPYHLVMIPRVGDRETEITFKLYFDPSQAPVATEIHSAIETPTTIPATAQEDSLFSSPMPIPSATPTPPPSAEERIALQYVAETYGVAIETLQIGTDYELTLPLIDRTFHVFGLFQADGSGEIREYSVLIDQATGEIEDDLNAIRAAEAAAHEAKYGKLDPALYERLGMVSDDTVLPVAVWAAGSEEALDTLEIYNILAAEFPEAAEALDNHMLPMEVDDPALSEQIMARYRALRDQGVRLRTQPVLDWFQQEGITVEDPGIAPYIHAELTKETILRLAKLDAVAMIDLTGATASPEEEQPRPDETGDLIGERLSFETIAYSETGASERWRDAEPKLLIITDPEAVETAKPYLFEEEGELLDAIDFTTHFAILAFRGWYSRTQGGFRIVAIVRQDDEISIVAEPGQRHNKEAESSPYHLVTIPRGSDWGTEVTFKLYFDPSQAPVASVAHYLE